MAAKSGGAPPAAPGYRVAASTAEAVLREKGSRFLALVSPADTVETAAATLAAIRLRFPDATHHCWAWRIGEAGRERASDDGEPSGTAGAPMLQVLRGADVSDVQATVVRWYGGTKLGKGGLARAYAGALNLAMDELPVARRVPTIEMLVEVDYERVGALKRLVRPPQIELVEEVYGTGARYRLAVQVQEVTLLEETLAEMRATWKRLDPSTD